MGAASSRPEPAHRSLNCRVPTTVEFVNDTGLTVQTVWINYNRDERIYFTLAPGAHVRQPTFTCHPWRFQAPDEPGVLCVVDDQAIFYPPPKPQPDAEPPQARIVLASSLPWSPRTHAAFPEAFRREAATLLCCHHRLQHAGHHRATSGGNAATPASAPKREHRQPSKCLPAWMAGLQRLGSGSASSIGRSRPGTPRTRRSEGDAAPAAAPSITHLGELPQELLLLVLAAAAPRIPRVVKPTMPPGVQPGDLLEEEAAQLFRAAGGEGGEGGEGEGGEGDHVAAAAQPQ